VNAEIETLPAKERLARDSEAFRALKKQIAGVHPYTQKEIAAGKWRKNPLPVIGAEDVGGFAPDGNWRELHDTGFSLRHPENWQVYDGPETAVTIAPKSGLAAGAGGASAVICGVLVDVYQAQKGSQLAPATEQLIAYLRQGNAGLQPLGAVKDVTAAERPAKAVELRNPQSGETVEHDWLVAMLRRDGSLEYVVFVAPERDFEGLRPVFEQVLTSFRIRE
jgi:hypothetical protein